jgi:hypothetical protein
VPEEFAIGGAVFGIPTLTSGPAKTPEELRTEIDRLRAALEAIASMQDCPQAAAHAASILK